MKRAGVVLLFFVFCGSMNWAQDYNHKKIPVMDYTVRDKDITNTVDFVSLNWIVRITPSPYADPITDLEILLYKSGNNSPVERIILKNGSRYENKKSVHFPYIRIASNEALRLAGWYEDYFDGSGGFISRLSVIEVNGGGSSIINLSWGISEFLTR